MPSLLDPKLEQFKGEKRDILPVGSYPYEKSYNISML